MWVEKAKTATKAEEDVRKRKREEEAEEIENKSEIAQQQKNKMPKKDVKSDKLVAKGAALSQNTASKLKNFSFNKS